MSIYWRKFKNTRTGEVWRLIKVDFAWFGFESEDKTERTTISIDDLIQDIQDGEMVMLPEEREP